MGKRLDLQAKPLRIQLCKKKKAEKNFASFQLCRCHAVNVSDNAAYFYNKINEDLKRGGVDVKAEDIIDIIDGYKGGGYGVSTQRELGGQDWVN